MMPINTSPQPEALTQTALPTEAHVAEKPTPVQPSRDAGSITQTDRSPTQLPTSDAAIATFATLELSFSDGRGRPLQFRDAVERLGTDRWALRSHAQPVLKLRDADLRCLGGTPGRWHEFYRDRSPMQFGLEPDLAVMYWDQRERRGRAASANVLQGILGDGWKKKLREFRDEKLRPGLAYAGQ